MDIPYRYDVIWHDNCVIDKIVEYIYLKYFLNSWVNNSTIIIYQVREFNMSITLEMRNKYYLFNIILFYRDLYWGYYSLMLVIKVYDYLCYILNNS